MKNIWIREYINESRHTDSLYFIKTNNTHYGCAIEQNNSWKSFQETLGAKSFVNTPDSQYAKDRPLETWEIVKLRLQGKISL